MPVILNKVSSPKYENNNVRQQLLTQALRMSYLDGSIKATEYNNGNVTEEEINTFAPMKTRLDKTMKENSPGYKVQMHVKRLIKTKLRIFSLSRESRYGNSRKKMSSTSYFFNPEKNSRPGTNMGERYFFIILVDMKVILMLAIDPRSNYSHLSAGRGRNQGKSPITIFGYVCISKRLEELYDSIINSCLGYIRELAENSNVIIAPKGRCTDESIKIKMKNDLLNSLMKIVKKYQRCRKSRRHI